MRFVPLLLLICILGVHAQTNESENNEAIARRFVESWTMENYLDLPKLFADNCIYLEMPSGRSFTSKEGIKNYASATLYGIPDTHTEVVSIIANDTMAAVEWIMSGTNSVGWPNIPASGKSFQVPIVTIMEIEDGLIIKSRDYWNWETFYNAVKGDDQPQ
jgi:steroid delta-isomerase-like uncharacterized protein